LAAGDEEAHAPALGPGVERAGRAHASRSTRARRAACSIACSRAKWRAPPDLGGPFDALIGADILEHLIDPRSTLPAYAALLEPGATVVVNLPNVGPSIKPA
jgi:2-polyprenyl-3-methyl-5-hydroxy-6-metoxy-1,4-benzoquinol methylase